MYHRKQSILNLII